MPGEHSQRAWLYDRAFYAPARYQHAFQYEAFIPDKLMGLSLSLDAKVAGMVSAAELAMRTLNQAVGTPPAPTSRLLLRTEAIASSRIEGLQVGIRDLSRAEARAGFGRNARATTTDVLANIQAMGLAVDTAGVERFDVDRITAIHRQLMERSEHQAIAGRIRTGQNWVGGNDFNPEGAEFVPPPPENVLALLHDLCAAINDDRLPPVVQAALVHAQFETIHPFMEGNGPTGRALIHVVLRRRGLAPFYVPPISLTLAASKTRYRKALMGFRGTDIDRWIEHFAGAASESAYLATAYREAVARLTLEWRERLKASASAPRQDAAAWALIDVLPGHPTLTAPIATAATGRAKAAVYDAIDQLTHAGVLTPLSKGKRNQSWEAVGLLDLLAGLEDGQPPIDA